MPPRDTQTMINVPDSDLATVVAGFEDEGATVEKTKQTDGQWTVVATFPPTP
jgi:hypothetical protein